MWKKFRQLQNKPPGSVPSDSSPLKDEPQTRIEQMKSEAPTPKVEPSTMDVKEEFDEPDTTGQVPDALQEEAQDVADAHPLDSEDSLSQEGVAMNSDDSRNCGRAQRSLKCE